MRRFFGFDQIRRLPRSGRSGGEEEVWRGLRVSVAGE